MAGLKKTLRVLILVWLCSWPSIAIGQNSFAIKGRVIAGDGKMPLPGAYVFLANTTRGTATDQDGNFRLDNLPDARFKLTVSFVGYESVVVEVQSGETKFYTIILKPAVTNLDEVVVRASRHGTSKWLTNLKTFKDYFIGLSDNASKCTIKNPRVLRFTLEDALFEATADSLLTVVNEGLGYKLTVLIEKFKVNKITLKVFFKGQVLYEVLTPENEKQKITWARNRLKAYYGSQLHFMRSVYDHQLIERGFVVNLFHEVYDDSVKKRKATADAEIKIKSNLYHKNIKVRAITNYKRLLDTLRSTPTHPILAYNRELEVVYIHEAESHQYHRHRDYEGLGLIRPQRSLLLLNGKDVSIESNGAVMLEDEIETKGYWSWELFSESLPVDYDPEEDETLLDPSYNVRRKGMQR